MSSSENRDIIQLLGLESSSSLLLCNGAAMEAPLIPMKIKAGHKVCGYMWIMRIGCAETEMYPSKIWKDMESYQLLQGHHRAIHYTMKKLVTNGYATISRRDTDRDSYRRGTGKRVFYSLTDEGMLLGEAIFNAHYKYFQQCMCMSKRGGFLA